MLIAQSMDSVEREFEVRDKHIQGLEAKLASTEADLAAANDVIRAQRSEIVQVSNVIKPFFRLSLIFRTDKQGKVL
jgi:hypothetical protein